MCGIFGLIDYSEINKDHFKQLALHARQRGRDSSGLLYYNDDNYAINRADLDIKQLLGSGKQYDTCFMMGHSRLITNGLEDNQPVVRDGICAIHNGIIVNDRSIWESIKMTPQFLIDSEVIIGIAAKHLNQGYTIKELPRIILSYCKGTVACALAFPNMGQILIFSNNGSLYTGKNKDATYFCSESYPLRKVRCSDIKQV
jgi:glutamine---fructose-6-phosphate transaminase (isomerizing)